MKNMRKNLLITDTWEDLWELVTGGPGAREATLKQKVSQISKLMTRFPGRKFILIGDSGEGDPEVFDRIRDTFPDQVQEIWVRDVINDREKNRARLKGMEIIPAPTIIPGVSQFDTN
jgi:phosphatidate phosphatase APP1